MADNLAERVRVLIDEALTSDLPGTAVDVEDVVVQRAGRRRLVKVLVDTDGGVSLDRVAEVTKVVSRVLDNSDVMGESPYVLEVGSPGVERPLGAPRHWRRNLGRLVRIRPSDGSDAYVARIADVTDTAAIVTLSDSTAAEVPFDEIETAVVQVEFNSGGE